MRRVINILLVEDDNLDQMEVKRTLERKNILHRLKVAKNGEDAIRVLNETSNEVYSGKPDIILLDLNMPKMNGHEFLAELRAMPEFSDIPVFITTTSGMDVDRLNAKNLGVSGYIMKPLDFETSTDMVDSMNLLETLLK